MTTPTPTPTPTKFACSHGKYTTEQSDYCSSLERGANGRCANGTCAGLRAVAQIQISQAARFHSPTKPTSRSVKHASLAQAQALAPQPAAFIPSRLLAFCLPAVPPRDFKSMVPVAAGVTVHLGAGCAVHARAALLVRFLHALRWR